MYRLSKLTRLNPLLLFQARPISNKIIDDFLGDYLSLESKKVLRDKFKEMDQDSHKTATAGQMQETGFAADRFIQRRPKQREPEAPKPEVLKRIGTTAERTLRLEVYSRALSLGMDNVKASEVADRAVQRAAILFEQKAKQTVDKFNEEAAQKETEKRIVDENEKQVVDFASKQLERIFAPRRQRPMERHKEVNYAPIFPDLTSEKIFGSSRNALNLFDVKHGKSAPTSYWAEMEKRKTDLANLSMGPTNAFEEQIQWTEQGRMWPYPIDNEYLMGDEEHISFADHIFLDKYVSENHKHLPKTGPITHFMELVCVGLSKNPYMTLSKKHKHLDDFAEFFSPEHIEKIHKLHEEAEKQAM